MNKAEKLFSSIETMERMLSDMKATLEIKEGRYNFFIESLGLEIARLVELKSKIEAENAQYKN